MKERIKAISLIIFFVACFQQSYSQCAMCKAVVESNLESGGSVGAGLNSGILYLMATPYIVMLIFGAAWYLQKKKINQTGD